MTETETASSFVVDHRNDKVIRLLTAQHQQNSKAETEVSLCNAPFGAQEDETCSTFLGGTTEDELDDSLGSDFSPNQVQDMMLDHSWSRSEDCDVVTVDRAPDFSGTWLCTRVEGDWEQYLKETGTAWLLRKTIASMGFGVRVQEEHIKQDSGAIEVTSVIKTCPQKEATLAFRTNGQEEVVTDVEGRAVLSTTRWEGEALVTEQRLADSLLPLPSIKRSFMDSKEMCTERCTPAGLVVRRFYTRA